MNYHGKLIGPNGEIYLCEHNHRTLTAAVTCANSSSTRHMAEMAWHRAAVQAAQAVALAKKREEERAAAEARRIAAREATAARQAAARAAAEEAKAVKRAAKLAAMSPQRAWKRMTPEERLLKTAESELEAYGKIISQEAKAAYDAHAAKRATAHAPTQSQSAPPGAAMAPVAHAAANDQKPSRPPSAGAAPRGPSNLAGSGTAGTDSSRNAAGRKPTAASPGFGGDGLFVVGLDITPGVYRTAGPASGCDGYFALLKSTSTRDIIENSIVRGPVTITVGPAVKAVEVRKCQPWHRLGDSLDEVIAAAGKPGDTAGRD